MNQDSLAMIYNKSIDKSTRKVMKGRDKALILMFQGF